MARRKTRRSRKRKFKRKRTVTRIPRLLGKSLLTRMRVASTVTMDPAAGSLLSYVFNCNGITQPGVTAPTTVQPTGFNEFNNFFESYKVLSSKIRMQWVPVSTANVIPGAFGVFVDNDVQLNYADYRDLIMGNQSSPNRVHVAGRYVTTKGNTASTSFSLKSYRRKNNVQSQALIGDSAANPTEGPFYQCWYGSLDGTGNPGAGTFIIIIDYVVQWFGKSLVTLTSPP